MGPAIIDSAYFQLPFWATDSLPLSNAKSIITNALRETDTKADINFTWDENMHQEKKNTYGKFFDFCAEKCVYN